MQLEEAYFIPLKSPAGCIKPGKTTTWTHRKGKMMAQNCKTTSQNGHDSRTLNPKPMIQHLWPRFIDGATRLRGRASPCGLGFMGLGFRVYGFGVYVGV